DPAKVDHYPSVTADAETVRKLLRYESSFFDLFGELYPYERLLCEEKVIMTGDDLLSALRKFKERGYNVAEKEWAEPVRTIFGTVFAFEKDPYAPEAVDGYRFLPREGDVFFRYYEELVWRGWRETDEPEIDRLIAQTENALKTLSLPVAQREYDDDIKEQYVRAFDNDDMRDEATDDEMALWIRYVEDLCDKGSKTALYAKAYSLYGGNRAYECDWCGSRDLLLKLMENDDNPFLANTLGYIFYYGRCTGGEPEYDKAFFYYNIGAAGGVYESRYKLADMYRHGYGVNKNERIASSIIGELYHENLKHIRNGHTDCKFADIALRMGNLYRDGVGMDEPDPDEAYRFYLEADFAIRQRLRDCNWYGDQSVAAGIGRSIDEILPQTSFNKPCYTVHMWTVAHLLSSAFALHRRVEAKIKKLKNGQYSLRFRILPKKGEACPPRFFITVPEAHFCGYLDHITVQTEMIYAFQIDGKRFDGEEATVIFDRIAYFSFEDYGACAMFLNAEFKIKFPSKRRGKTHRFVSVTFSDGGRHYDFLCDLSDVNVGDEVIVPSRDGEARVRVVSVFERSESETTLPIAKYRSVLRKI
ncbi:MAG: sel1 repeat family protein, partial [Clostridia bacterium]|nr:sel1 repeat family protein [Clostridia bacterium]